MASDLIQVLDDSSFAAALKTDTLTLVDFWAPWCGPCLRVAPTLDDLATEYDGKVRIAKVNVEENQESAADSGVENIPAFVLYHNGVELGRLVGALPKSAFRKFLDLHLEQVLAASATDDATVEQTA